MKISNEIINFLPEIKNWRHELHSHPELGYEEEWTSNFVAEKLESFGIEVHKGLGKTEAENLAAKETLDLAKIEFAEQLRFTLIQTQKIQEIETLFKTYRNSNGEVDLANAYRSLMAQDNLNPTPNLERTVDIERGKAHQLMADLLDQMKYKMGGRQSKLQKTNLKLMVRELMGENTGNVNAKQLSEAWKQTAEHLRKRFNSQK